MVKSLYENRKVIVSGDTPWVVSSSESKAVQMAIRDLREDWYKVFGYPPIILNSLPESKFDLETFLLFGKRDKWKDIINLGSLNGDEIFEFKTITLKQGKKIFTATGEGLRGAIYAIYSFSEKFLGIDPLYYWTDKLPKKLKNIKISANMSKKFGPPTFKYRGWFINDEDIFAGWRHDPLEENVFSLEMWDKIYETILRLKGNMVVPGTFTFPDESCRKLADKRGLILNDHHVTPLGLVTFDWPEEQDYSYVTNAAALEKSWKKCINAQKNREIVWTVSFRGKNDGPFWYWDDNAPESEKERAKVISDAVNKQIELIREVQANAPIIFNMYDEQAELFKKGLINIPEEIICVWPDDGAGIIKDGNQVKKGDGVYYHVIGAARNRFTEGVRPKRIYSQLARFVKAEATEFCLINVSNIRNVVLSCDTIMKFIWQADSFLKGNPMDVEKETIITWCRKQFGETIAKDVAELYVAFFSCSNLRKPEPGKPPKDASDLGEPKALWSSQFNQILPDFRLHLYMHRLTNHLIDCINKRRSNYQKLDFIIKEFKSILTEDGANLNSVHRQAHILRKKIPNTRKKFYQAHVLTQIDILYYSNKAMLELSQGILFFYDSKETKTCSYLKKALTYLEKVINTIHKGEKGKWTGWYLYERFTCIHHTRDLLRKVLAMLNNETLPIIRQYWGWGKFWPEAYRYHKKAESNFPLFYGEQNKENT